MTDHHDHHHRPIELPHPLTIAPVYANMMSVSHTKIEFLCAFGMIMAGPHTVVALSPVTAKQVLRALATNIEHYEERFGEIEVPGNEKSPSPER